MHGPLPTQSTNPPSSTFNTEPAVFLVNPAGLLHVMVYSNASFARPDLKQIVQGERGVGEGELRCGCMMGGVRRHLPPSTAVLPRSLPLPPIAAGIKMIQDRKQPIRGTYY